MQDCDNGLQLKLSYQNHLIQMMLVILLFLMPKLMISFEFYLNRRLSLCCMNSVKGITPLLNGGVIVEAATPSVTVLKGANFNIKLAQIEADSSVSKIITTLNGGVFFGNRSKIICKNVGKYTNATFAEELLLGSMIVTDKYVLVEQYGNALTTLKKVDFQQLQVETLTYNAPSLSIQLKACLKDFTNGQIILAKASTVYLLNNKTLQVEQQFGDAQISYDYGFTSVDSYLTKAESVILIRKGENAFGTYRFNVSIKQSQPFITFYALTDAFILTSPNTAASIWNGNLFYWEDFDKQIIAQSWNAQEYVGDQTPIAVSNSQDIFAMVNNIGDQIRFCTLTADNKITTILSFQKQKGSLLQAKFANHDKYLIYSQRNQITLAYELYKFDLVTKQKTKMDDDQTTKALAFLVMGDFSIIVFVNRAISNQTKNYAQLRDIATFSLIFQLQVKLNTTLFKCKLLGNNFWNLNFILLVKSMDGSNQASNVLRFRYIQNKGSIQFLSSESRDFSFQSTFACNKYLINAQRYNSIDVYYAQNFTLAKSLTDHFQHDYFFSQKSILIAQVSSSSVALASVYDFSKDIDNFEQGMFFNRYSISPYDKFMRVLFPERRLYLLCNAGNQGLKYPNKLIYDLSNFPIKRWLPLPVHNPISIIMTQAHTNSSCIWTYMIYDQKLLKYNDCDPSNNQVIPYYSFNQNIFISKNKKYLLLIYWIKKASYVYNVEVRLASNIEILVKKLVITGYSQNFKNIDITQDLKIVIHLQNHILVFDMERQQNIANFDIQSIDLFDASKNIVVIIGKSSSTLNESRLIIKKLNDTQPLMLLSLNSPPKIVKLSQTAKRIAVYDSNFKLIVWDVQSQTLLFQEIFEGTLDMKFINDANILLQFAQNVSIISLNRFQTIKNKQFSLSVIKIVANNNGSFLAALVNSTSLKIFDSSINQIFNYTAPANSYLVDIAFSQKDEVYAITQNGTLFVISQCPETYISLGSRCVCPEYASDTGNKCSCYPKFVRLGNKCIYELLLIANQCNCPKELTYINGNCIQCSFLCNYCDNAGLFDCTEYSLIFYVITVATPLVGLVIIFIIMKRRWENINLRQSNLTEDKHNNSSKNQRSLGQHLNSNGKKNDE